MGTPQLEFAGVNMGRITDTGTVGKNKPTPNPKPSNSSKPPSKDSKPVEGTKGTGNLKPQGLMDELANSGVKYNPNVVVAVTKNADGKIVWLENGNSQAGFNHIFNHANEFSTKGITQRQLPEFITKAVSEGKIVGYQGKGTGRPIYEINFNGQTQRVAITTGSNGFIVGANPVSIK